MTTPKFWHRFADFMSPVKDMTPESWRYLFKSYAAGPLAAVIVAMDDDKLAISGMPSTADTLGVPLMALGMNSFYMTKQDTNRAAYFSYYNKLEKELLRRGVILTDSDTKPGEKEAIITRNMRAGGFSANDIQFAILCYRADQEIEDLRTDFRAEYKDLRFTDPKWDFENIEKVAEKLYSAISKERNRAVKYVNEHPLSF
jgi:hypothetical protein